MSGLLQDFWYALRTLSKSPGFATAAILTLALGIGANSAIFHVLDAALLRDLPVPHPESLVLLTDPDSHGHSYGSAGGNRSLLAFWEYQFLRDHNDVFSGIFAVDSDLAQRDITLPYAGKQLQEGASIRLVTGEYFSTLGITAIAGHTFGPESDRARGASPVAVISFNYWTRRFSNDPSAVGTKFTVNGVPFQIVGIAPAGFAGETIGQRPDIWVPMTMQDAIYPGEDLLATAPRVLDQHIWLQVMARRRSGITSRQAQANIDVVNRRLMEAAAQSLPNQDRGNYPGQRIVVHPGSVGSSVLRRMFAEPLWILMALVGLVLLIACANVANLLLARHAARQKEFALRLALGASRWRSIRQLLAECLILAGLGAVLGFLLAQWADMALVRLVPGANGRPGDLQLNLTSDLRILLFTAVVALLTIVLSGLLPAFSATRVDLSEALKSNSGSSMGGPIHRFSLVRLLIVGQVAISLVMLVVTGLFVRSLVKLTQVSVGFEREHLLAFRLNPVTARLKGAAILSLHERLLDTVSNIPGVRAVTLSGNGLFEQTESGDPISVEDYTPDPADHPHSLMDHVGPGYFSTVGIRVLTGREIARQDSGAGERVALVNESFVRRFFPNTNPIGRHVSDTYYSTPQVMTIIGVVADAKQNSVKEQARPRLYVPFFKPLWEQPSAFYEVRTVGESAQVGIALRQAVNAAAPALPAIEIQSVGELVDNSLGTARLVARLSGAFSLLAMLLASVGLFGVMSWAIARRTREIGIRMAVGGLPATIFRLVLRDAVLTVSVGIALGIPLALIGTRVVRGLLFGIGPADPLVIAAATILLLTIAVLAAYLPANRAAKVDPMHALRHE
ncbi:MAG TPA: ABC transporter permease [Bryobacteraceae bacterium]|nr:ABC transporter permease [Bryobacteraceae bacterium]